MNQPDEPEQYYALTIREPMDRFLLAWMDGFSIISQNEGQTVLQGPVRDQPALRNLMEHLWNFNLTIVSVNPVVSNNPYSSPHSASMVSGGDNNDSVFFC